MITRRRLTVAAACIATGVVALAGCSSSGSSSAKGTTPSNAPANAAVAAALKDIAPYEVATPTISLPPLKSKPPGGKTIDFVGCPLAPCLEIQQAAQAAAKAIGWTVKVFNGGLSPAEYLSAWDSVVQTPNDGVLGIGTLPNTTIQSQLTQLKSKGIPYVSVSSVSPVDSEMIANFAAAPEIAQAGKVTADWIIANSKAEAHVAYFWDPSLAQNKPGTEAFAAQMSSLCPNCSTDVQTTNFLSGIGATDPPQIVSYLQRNPKVDYLVLGLGSGAAGVPQALAAAGLAGKVKIVTRLADPVNFKDIQQGTEVMGVTEETFEAGWRMVDVITRHMQGMSFDPTPIGTIHVVTKENLPADISQAYSVPNYQSYFKKAWLLSS